MEIEEIKARLKEEQEEFSARLKKKGGGEALQHLSLFIRKAQEAEMDVTLTMISQPGEQAFSLFRQGAITVPFSGILTMGKTRHLLALCTGVGEKPSLKLAISEFDISLQGNSQDVRSSIFDLPGDWKKFEGWIVKNYAREAYLRSCDLGEVFDGAAARNVTAVRKLVPPLGLSRQKCPA